MRAFTQLVEQLNRSTSGETSQAALLDYVLHSPEDDLGWAIALLLDSRPFPRLVTQKQLITAAKNAAGLSDWLVDVCRSEVGDAAEVAALLAPRGTQTLLGSLSSFIKTRCLPLRGLDDKAQQAFLCSAWRELDLRTRRVWHRMILGTLQFRLKRPSLAAALAHRYSVPAPLILQRLDSPALPIISPDWLTSLASSPEPDERLGWAFEWGQLSGWSPSALDGTSKPDWICEWKPRGRRIQLVHRTDRTFVWSEEGDLLNRELPELIRAAQALEVGVVLEGTWVVEPPEVHTEPKHQPASGGFWVEDVLEYDGMDQRDQTLGRRRQRLEQILGLGENRFRKDERIVPSAKELQTVLQPELFIGDTIPPSETNPWPFRQVAATPIEEWRTLPKLRELARSDGYSGLQLRWIQGTHPASQTWRADHGMWLPNDLRHCTVALLSVEFGESGSAYSLGIHHDGRWLTIARILGEPPEPERDQIASFVRAHTTQKFGSTRLLEPSLLVRLSYDHKTHSSRHKAGIRLIGARWIGLLRDASLQDCFRLDDF